MNGSLGGRPFRIDPSSVNWNFTVKTNAVETVGGRVVQVYGVDLGDMTVVGSFGVGGWREQKAFLDRIIALADVQVANNRIQNSKANPIHFSYPSRKWDFQVYLLGYEDPSAGASVRWDVETINPQWQLKLFIAEDNSGIVKVAKDAFISRFSEGLGWQQNQYNGPAEVLTDVAAAEAAFTKPLVDAATAFGGGTPAP